MIGSILNERYRIDDEIGQGGMGTVYRGFDSTLDAKTRQGLMLLVGYGVFVVIIWLMMFKPF